MSLASWATYSETWASTSDEWNPTYTALATFNQNLGQTSDNVFKGVGSATLATDLSSVVNINHPCSITLTNNLGKTSTGTMTMPAALELISNLGKSAGEDVVMTFTVSLDLSTGFPNKATDSWADVGTSWATDGTTWDGLYATIAVAKSAQLDTNLTKSADEDQVMPGAVTFATDLTESVGEDQIMPSSVTFAGSFDKSSIGAHQAVGTSTFPVDLDQSASSIFITTGSATLEAALTQIHNVNHPVSISLPATLDASGVSSFLWEVIDEITSSWSEITEDTTGWTTISETTSSWTRRDNDGDKST